MSMKQLDINNRIHVLINWNPLNQDLDKQLTVNSRKTKNITYHFEVKPETGETKWLPSELWTIGGLQTVVQTG